MNKSSRYVIIVCAGLAMLAGFWFGQKNEQHNNQQASLTTATDFQGIKFNPARKLGIPHLQKDNEQLFSKQDLEGKWSLLFYGYTHCPDICPATLNTVAVAKRESRAFPQVVFVSVDPKRDDARLVNAYVRYFDKEFVGVTGEEKLLQAMAMQMSVASMSVPSDKPEEYLVDHSSNLLLLNPAVELVAMLRPPHTVQSIRQALDALMQ